MLQEKTLMLRLSSLGDVILSTSVLQVESIPPKVDWVVASEFSEVLRGHPRIETLWCYDRTQKGNSKLFGGLKSWLLLARQLWEARYTQVFDLHRTLRTRILQ